eukprot:1517987-Pyramimonas_sp.AAC.1
MPSNTETPGTQTKYGPGIVCEPPHVSALQFARPNTGRTRLGRLACVRHLRRHEPLQAPPRRRRMRRI